MGYYYRMLHTMLCYRIHRVTLWSWLSQQLRAWTDPPSFFLLVGDCPEDYNVVWGTEDINGL